MVVKIEPHRLRGVATVHSGDWENGAYWLAAGAIGGVIRVENLGENSKKSEAAIVSLLDAFGGTIERRGGDVRATHRPLCSPREIDLSGCPGLLEILSVVACYGRVTTRLRLASVPGRERMRKPGREIRARFPGEGERLRLLREMLVGLGGIARAESDRIHIRGSTLRGGIVYSEKALPLIPAAVVAATYAGGETYLTNAEAVLAMHSDFFKTFRLLGGKYTLQHSLPS